MTDERNEFVETHVPCDACGSSDARSVRADGSSYCFACETNFPATEGDDNVLRTTSDTSAADRASKREKGFLKVDFEALPKRGIREETCRKWSYGRADFGDAGRVHVAQFRDSSGSVIAQKVRTRDKKFPWIGNRKAFEGLYGQWLWSGSGPRIVITEGEIDALTVSQLNGNKWPVVSLPDGTGSVDASLSEALKFLEGYDKIILMFDNDKPGRKAVEKACHILPPGKVYIASLPADINDPNDALMKDRGDEVMSAMWEATQWHPKGFLSGDDVLAKMRDRPTISSIPYPSEWKVLNERTYGIRLGELDVWTSGTGMGKTTVIKAVQHHLYHNSGHNQAIFALEEPVADTADDLVGYELGKRIKLPDIRDEVGQSFIDDTAERLFKAVDDEGRPRLQLFDAFGSIEDGRLMSLLRYAVKAYGCRILWIDHLSILVSDMDIDADERRQIDRIMHKLKALTVELNVYVGLISHLKKATGGGKSFEEGAVPSLDDLRGSGGIKQLANGVYALSRNQQHDDPVARNTTSLHVLKCRYTGRTGPADHLFFDDHTGRLVPGADPSTIGETSGMKAEEEY